MDENKIITTEDNNSRSQIQLIIDEKLNHDEQQLPSKEDVSEHLITEEPIEVSIQQEAEYISTEEPIEVPVQEVFNNFITEEPRETSNTNINEIKNPFDFLNDPNKMNLLISVNQILNIDKSNNNLFELLSLSIIYR